MSALENYYRAKYEKYKTLPRWREKLPELLEAVKSVLPDAEIYIFGSTLKDKLTANSDIDVLAVSNKVLGSQHHKLAIAIEEKLGTPPILEIHLTTKEELTRYKNMLKS